MKLRRVAYFLNVFPKLSETFIAHELAELKRRGLELCVFSLRAPSDPFQHEMIAREGLDALTCYDPARVTERLQAFRPQLLHAHFATEPAAAAREWARRLGLPFTFTAHGYDIRRKPPPDFADRAAAASAVITVSEANREHILRSFGVPADKLYVIPCGVDVHQFRPRAVWPEPALAAGKAPGDTDSDSSQPGVRGEPLIVCVARHVRVKNLGLLLRACAQLRDRAVAFHCVSVGDGVCRGELEALRSELGLEDVVEFVGAQEQRAVADWWQRARVAVLTSESEGMPICLMEAGACGVPAVATAVGGVPEFLEHRKSGLLVPPGDTDRLADALQRLLERPEEAAEMGRAARARVVEKFSLTRQVDDLLALWSNVAAAAQPVTNPSKVRTSDAFGAADDPSLPTVRPALDPEVVNDEFRHALGRVAGPGGRVSVRTIQVIRHKPGKRAVIEYGVRVKPASAPWSRALLLGKIRARRFGNEAFRLQEALWNAGFQADSADGVSVPEPLAVIPHFRMWLQRKVPGAVASQLLGGPDGIILARRIAEAIHKLHRAGVQTGKVHAMEDELRILRQCLPLAAQAHPQWRSRLARVLTASTELGATVARGKTCGIHRDFYPAQVIVDGGRLWLLDFDLYCQGDPGLDVGNFIGHITEESLRTREDAAAWQDREQAMEDRFVELSGESVRASVRVYTILTLARHIYLSTQFPERAAWTEAVLELCEQRLGLRD
jgi:glycosyltransferase involved in cell wall biosynthesis/tRNA A-37 threonylcarbamoyl transferase component Bud32